MKSALTCRAALGLFVLQCLIAISTAKASVITLTGGDPGEGYSPAVNKIYAYDLHNSGAAHSIQGVSFTTFDGASPATGPSGNFTISGFSGYGAGVPSLGVTPNDVALAAINTNFFFLYDTTHSPTNLGTLTLTLQNLTPGQTYQVDAFVNTTSADSNDYPEAFLFNGAQPDSFTALNQVYYDVRENVVANGSGDIIVTLNSSGIGSARLNAFSVTQTPEPTSFLLLGLGALGLWVRCHARAKA